MCQCVNQKMANAIACSLIASRIDYCNAIFSGLSNYNVCRLQRMQNAIARVVVNDYSRLHVSEVLQSLHWLPIQFRIDYKISLLTYKILSTGEPSYLFDMLFFHVPARSLRSSADGPRLEIPFCKTVLASRAFSIYAPRLWNGLPLPLRNSISPSNPPSASLPLSTFTSMLKTHFSTLAFEAGTV